MATNVQNPLERTKKLIAKTGAFRTWCGIDTTQSEQDQYDDAKARINTHLAPADTTRPFALITWGDDRRYERRSSAGYMFNANVEVRFFNDFPAETAENIQTFDDNVSGIIDEAISISGEGDLIEWDTVSFQNFDIMEVEQGTDIIVGTWSFDGAQWGVSEV